MTVQSFLKFVEIQTKLASVFPFLLGAAYSVYRFGVFRPARFFVMFLSLICFDMATTGMNNYIDFKTAAKREGYNFQEQNAMGKYGIRPNTAVLTIAALLCLATFFGILLALMTNIVVPALGALCFIAGIGYTFGPLPISRTPFGEAVSGIVMGLGGVFLAAYVHVADAALITTDYTAGQLTVSLDIRGLVSIALFAAPPVFCIADMMLANNLCDIEDDRANQRKTLPISIGRKNALRLFAALYALAYLSIPLGVALGDLPVYYMLGLLSGFFVYHNTLIFFKRQTKAETFSLSVKNFAIINTLNLLILLFAIAMKHL
ncbi:MAG: 1,4-dihydroxy-2-naphthoate polyprenyltransferase [Clostridiales bacterium]|nr:1,4-dihydroxy-2-naphthoate polyprenyltransferase [Clostridiales bacterium]